MTTERYFCCGNDGGLLREPGSVHQGGEEDCTRRSLRVGSFIEGYIFLAQYRAQSVGQRRKAVRYFCRQIADPCRVLWAYAKKNPQVQVTYLVSGETTTERIFRVVPAAELDGAFVSNAPLKVFAGAKKALQRVTGVHVFSLQEQTPKVSAR